MLHLEIFEAKQKNKYHTKLSLKENKGDLYSVSLKE